MRTARRSCAVRGYGRRLLRRVVAAWAAKESTENAHGLRSTPFVSSQTGQTRSPNARSFLISVASFLQVIVVDLGGT